MAAGVEEMVPLDMIAGSWVHYCSPPLHGSFVEALPFSAEKNLPSISCCGADLISQLLVSGLEWVSYGPMRRTCRKRERNGT